MNLARTIGVGAGFLGILAYGHLIPVRLAVLIFWLSGLATAFTMLQERRERAASVALAGVAFSLPSECGR
jgi:hypothetical protein